VSLTYDDGPDAHLDHAVPDLEAAGLKGTFYVPTHVGPPHNCWAARAAEWREAARRGHEVGNHTQFHPCSAAWVRPNFKLEAYSLARMESELLSAGRDVAEVTGIPGPRSYAYTCSQEFVGPDRQSYRPIVDRLFPAARSGPKRRLVDPMTVEFASVPAWKMDGETDVDDAIAFIDEAAGHGGWAVLLFHGVAGGHGINVSREFHRAICRHVAGRRDEIWCDTFVNVALHLRRATGRPWTP
jgi:peptidoglycan/xylan/chitin deacetylase (PgdA/CDA1 family)